VVDDGAHGEFGVLFFDGDEQFGDVVGDLARAAAASRLVARSTAMTAGSTVAGRSRGTFLVTL